MRIEPLWIPASSPRLFGVLHVATAPARAAILLCAPILHEYVRSHRLFALLAHELCERGFDVLRFDYRGCGDSEGDAEEFLMSQADAEAAFCADFLRRRNPAVPLVALGVRAGAHVAARLVRERIADALWLWQPVVDGASYLAGLRQRDADERSSPMRYPMARTIPPGATDSLMGYPFTTRLFDELEQLAWSDAGIDAARVTLLDAGVGAASPAHARFVELPVPLSAWAEEIDMSRVAVAPIRTIADALAAGTIAR
ncbi:serine aminopeptidase domain-containing protein [Dokdonella immobilis]|uniref:Alpha/beta superfamily hydrolase n=1 Tax=Dokdonella immobilis TaxID=578942 RepID=A0A1I4VFD1_9GAMM|nr:alpha/beta hydrolase [Dokdonella immobilis]SFM99937.1 Alpha/beta superfamily hydrolase [Dokdonella immobilis]